MPRVSRTRRADQKLHCRLPVPLHDRLQEEAGRRQTTVTAILNDLLEHALSPVPSGEYSEDAPAGYHDFNGDFDPGLLERLRDHSRRRFTPVRFVVIQAILTHLNATQAPDDQPCQWPVIP